MIPHPAFLNLEHERQENIRNACLEEFVKGGYNGASTNTMCKNACISKGLLFYYFESKKDLYFYLIEHCTKLINEVFFEELEFKKENMFDRIMSWTLRKWALYDKYPLQYGFLAKQLLESSTDVEQFINKMKNENKTYAIELFMKNLDTSNLRSGVSLEKAVETILFVIEGVREKNIACYKQSPRPLNELHDEILPGLREYLDICRLGICADEDNARQGEV